MKTCSIKNTDLSSNASEKIKIKNKASIKY